jgi:hypothetical protein
MSGTIPANTQIDPNSGAVLLNYQKFAALFPTLAVPSITEDMCQAWWMVAGTNYFNNTSGSPCADPAKRENILMWVTAHLLTLFVPINGEQPSTLVGRISNASEGSVSVGVDMGNQPQSAAWWNQTPFGAAAYNMMRKYALTRYFPGPRPVFDPVPLPVGIWPVR